MSLRARRPDREGTFSGNKAERAIIDIGSNTVRMVVYGGSMRAPTVLLNEKVTARLGRDIAETGQLAEEAIDIAEVQKEIEGLESQLLDVRGKMAGYLKQLGVEVGTGGTP